jgi:tetratricopeptide (TPR) repeat protein
MSASPVRYQPTFLMSKDGSMVRLGLFFLMGATLAFIASPFVQVIANPPADPKITFRNVLLVQRAMEQARDYLLQPDNKKAVQILEEHVKLVDGKQDYLKLLRKAYRAYITELWIANQPALAEEYLDKLTALEPSAANDPTLRRAASDKTFRDATPLPAKGPQAAAANPPTAAPTPAAPTPAALASATPPEAKNVGKPSPPAAGPKPSTVRAKTDDDPFDPANQQPASRAVAGEPNPQARALLAQAEAEYRERRFAEARQRFEQAYRADPQVLDASRDRWAYCRLFQVVEQLNQPNLDTAVLASLHQEVQAAMSLAQAPRLAETGKGLLREIEDRSKKPAAAASAGWAVQHHPGSIQGWQMAETPHFRILHNQPRDFVEKAAHIAEHTRQEMYRKWFGNDGPEWTPKCDLYLHATAHDYSRLTGVPSTSPGHSRIENDPQSGRVVSRRLDLHCSNPTLLQAVLPHETTHVVLAGQFGKHAVPRWADEGIAVLTEPREKVDQHRRNLARCHQEGQLFGVRDLMNLNDYPHASRISAFYAQSVVLVEFLSQQRGPQVFSQFLREGLDQGYENALRKHYNYRDFGELQERWGQVLTAEMNRPATTTAGYLGR